MTIFHEYGALSHARFARVVAPLLFVDASSTCLGFTLAQIQNGKEVVIAHNGRGLNRAEQNYSTTEGEALPFVEGIKKILALFTQS